MRRVFALVLAIIVVAVPVVAESANIVLTKFQEHPDGRCEFVFTVNGSGGLGWEFASCEDARVFATTLGASEENLVRFLISYWMARSPDFSNQNIILNKEMTVDFGAANPIKVQ